MVYIADQNDLLDNNVLSVEYKYNHKYLDKFVDD